MTRAFRFGTKTPRAQATAGFFAFLALAVALPFAGCHPRTAAPDPDTLYQTTTRFRGFEPAVAGDSATIDACGKIFESLYQYNYWDRPYRVEPLLAAAMPEVSEDGLVWTIPLRHGIYFADDPCFPGGKGRELTAHDFVYSFLRIADPSVGSSGYWVFRGKIAGLDEFRQRAANESADYDNPPEGFRALDDHTLQITLAEPYPQLNWILAMPYCFVVAREAVEFYGADFQNHPVGTGPYVLAEMRQNHRYEYRANPAWTDPDHPRLDAIPADAPTPDAGRRLPLTPRIVESIVGDASTAWLLFLSHALDITGIGNDQWDSVIAATSDGPALRPEIAAQGIRLEAKPTLAVSYYSFNIDDPVVGPNRPLRQALAHAFDFAEWSRFVNGRLLPANSILPPGVAGYDPDAPLPYPFDLDRARELLAEAGYPGGRDPATGRRLEITLEIGNADSPEVRQSAELFASFMDKIGVKIQPSYNNWPTFLKKIELRQAQMFGLIWLGDYPDAQNFLQLFYSKNVSPGPNRCNYVNPAFDDVYERLVALPDSPEREALCREAVRIVLGDCPWIVVGYPLAFNLQQPRLRNSIRSDFSWGREKYLAVR